MQDFYKYFDTLHNEMKNEIYKLDNTYHNLFTNTLFKLELSYMSQKINRTSEFKHSSIINQYPKFSELNIPNTEFVAPDEFQIFISKNKNGNVVYDIHQNKSHKYGRFNSMEEKYDVISVITSCLQYVLCYTNTNTFEEQNVYIIFGTDTIRAELLLVSQKSSNNVCFNSYRYEYRETSYPLYDDYDDYDDHAWSR